MLRRNHVCFDTSFLGYARQATRRTQKSHLLRYNILYPKDPTVIHKIILEQFTTMMVRSSILLLSLLASASSFTSLQPRFFIAKPQAHRTTLGSSPIKQSAAELQSEEYQQQELPKSVIYTSSIKSPKDSYIAFAEKGSSNAKMTKSKILHQSILGGAYVGFGSLLSLSVAGNMSGIGASNPGLVKMVFAALFPVNLLLILTTGGQLFTGNTAAVAAAYYEGLVNKRELASSWAISLFGNVIGCGMMALAASYTGILTGGTAALCSNMAVHKCFGATFGQKFVKAILCNWMVSIAVFLAGATSDLAGKLVAVWFPISTFVAIGLEHSVANLFILPAAMLLKAPISLGVVMSNLIPVVLGNAVAGAVVVAGSYSYQFGRLGAGAGRKKNRCVNGAVPNKSKKDANSRKTLPL
jgi:formate/nitrite transporter